MKLKITMGKEKMEKKVVPLGMDKEQMDRISM